MQFWEPQKVSDLDLDLGSGQGHTGMHNSLRIGLRARQTV